MSPRTAVTESDTYSESYYPSSLTHILAELERIDLLIRSQVARARQIDSTDDQFRGLCISEQEVDRLLQEPAGFPNWARSSLSAPGVTAALEALAGQIRRCRNETIQRGILLRLDRLVQLFGLTPFETDALLLCLAPEIDLRYERLYGYLQDDITKKKPTVDLVLNLLCRSFNEKLAARRYFEPESPLLHHRLLQWVDDPASPHPPLLGKPLKVDPKIADYLLDCNAVDRQIAPYVDLQGPTANSDDLCLATEFKERLRRTVRHYYETGQDLVLYLQGVSGAGKQTLAAALCGELGAPLLTVDSRRLLEFGAKDCSIAMRLVMREALIQGAALYWRDFDVLLTEDKQTELKTLLQELGNRRGLTFLVGQTAWEPPSALQALAYLRVEFPRLTLTESVRIWRKVVAGVTCAADVALPDLAGQFRFTGSQIRDAAATACNLARWRNPERIELTQSDLLAACRLRSNQHLATLAQKITPHYHWNDIVLPADRLQQLREICHCVKYRALVYDDWGFDRKLSLGKGVNALFAGPSGTGKTMAVEIIAGELGLDAYKIDLSTVVSKYIGETEKNLARIFAEAETSNAILFFDEADALFGRRSEVRDSHDRYANLEIAYLLQRMEEYEGIVILASNLRKNMDDAFVRRIHCTIEFPFPGEAERRRIWEGIWPAKTPRSSDLNLDLMARRFEVAGGTIRNIVLTAAFLAADDGGVVTMKHLFQATRREYQKMGKVVKEGEFG